MKRSSTTFFVIMLLVMMSAGLVHAHCQIPCGIYDDDARITLMKEHVKTIQKSIVKIKELSKEQKLDHNQIVRWVNNKDEHADKLANIVTYYFMAQRVKPVDDGTEKEKQAYQKKLELLHKILITSMKAKQSVDLVYITQLEKLIHDFEHEYK